jgi:replicative DNA helicase Mcm
MSLIADYLKTEKAHDEIIKIGERYPQKQLLYLDFKDIERFNLELADRIRQEPEEVAEEFEKEALPHIITTSEKEVVIKAAFSNIPLEYSPKIGEINERHKNQLMRVEGMITQATFIYPKIILGNFRCNTCDGVENVKQSGFYPGGGGVKQPGFCRQCGRQREFRLSLDNSLYTTAQVMSLSEHPDLLRAGEKPASLTVYLTGDLVRTKFDIMDKVAIDGILKFAPINKRTDQQVMWFLQASNIEITNKGFDDISITPEDEKKILDLSKMTNLLAKLGQSLAPTVYGHVEMKESLILMLFGGTEKEFVDARRRSTINVLAMTDPGIGKSIIATALVNMSPRGIYTTGAGSKTGGLTSTAEKDPLSGEWMIKPGALPMASGGVLACDEFTTLGSDEMESLREGMEQNIVSVTKAGKSIQFSAKASIFACGNPKEGRFSTYTPFISQFGIQAPILSRFDLIFVMTDVIDSETDGELADTIFNVHQNKIKGGPIDKDLVRRYISYAKRNCKPILSDGAVRILKSYYTKLRMRGKEAGTIPATPRQLEALIRLAEAAAKVRLAKEANEQDALTATGIMDASLRQVATDMKSGVFDIDMVNTGKPKTERDKNRRVRDELLTLLKQNHEVDELEFKEQLATNNPEIRVQDIERVIEEMRNKGEIYSPKHGKIHECT